MNAQENSGLASGGQGLYRESFEHDACGIGALVNIKGIRSHQTVQDALSILNNMEHRGGKGLEHNTGDGAGILFQIPHRFFRFEAQRWGHLLPQEGEYGVAMIFFPQEAQAVERAKRIFEDVCETRGIPFLFWREVPTDASELGQTALSCMPTVAQAFVGRPEGLADEDAFERALYVARRLIEKEVAATAELADEIFYICSQSCRTIVYKGMLVAPQLRTFYIDLNDARVESSLALVHSRYSTNTTPSWERAHPNRYMIHNGEINTLRGNVNWMTARETNLYSHVFGEDLNDILPVLDKNGSDSAILDNMLEFLTLSGKSLSRSAMMLLPEPWVHNTDLSEKVRAFLAYQAALMEPWDGPAALAFTDGRKTGAILDRNGLRPARYYVTKDDRLILASEVGVLDIDPALILQKGGLKPGEMLLVDPDKGLIIYDDEIKNELASQKPYGEWLKKEMLELDSMDSIADESLVCPIDEDALIQTLETYGYIYEDVRDFVEPMATLASEPTASMGVDTPLAVLSKRDKPLFSYFKQMFAQVTNPPIDSLREEIVTAMDVYIGTTGNLLEDTKENCRLIHLSSPILTQAQFRELVEIDKVGFSSKQFRTVYNRDADESIGLENALESLNADVLQAVKDGCNVVVLSDRVCQGEVPIPSLLAVASVHHHLIREGLRTQADIVIETGDAKEVHDFAMLVGYGAGGIYPYLAHDLIAHLHTQNSLKGLAIADAITNFNDAVGHGIVKIMSKMGISTIQSYQGSQIFEAVGVAPSVIDRYFTHTVTRVGGLGIADLQREANHKYDEALRHAAFGGPKALPSGGERKFRADKEEHLFDPKTILLLQSSVRDDDYDSFKQYSSRFNDDGVNITLRSLLRFKNDRASIDIDEVESEREIVKRFKTGAMSYGSISKESHETLAIAMNRLGGKSNSGEGGEDITREITDENGDSRMSAIKQVASGRFGVTSRYLCSAKEIQIKMAQGAKPGEGGYLPGKKVYPWIAKTRRSTPGVGLISPPPHHDIYSIEDLAELIFDLKNANNQADINVKLVSEAGVGTIATGVAKGGASLILISGHDGGTGASPLSSIYHAGLPLELGLAETQQTLLRNGLRSRVRIEADGKLMTGRDVAIACLLGAEEFGFATAPLIAMGCLMQRACHQDTCPIGIATQNRELRSCFKGKPEHVENFMLFIAREMREYMAELGFRTVQEMVGHVECLEQGKIVDNWKAGTVDLSQILEPAQSLFSTIEGSEIPHYDPSMAYDYELETILDETLLLPLTTKAIEENTPVEFTVDISNVNRCVGTVLGSHITRAYPDGLAEDLIKIRCIGSGGQSFGAFVPKGIELSISGDANDYFGKGLSGGTLSVAPPAEASFVASENMIIGNVAFYGATSGKGYINGVAGQRFAVRNSGAELVVEGVDNHGCEYMTGGIVLVLGPVGINFAAGMSGGIAYVYDAKKSLEHRLNPDMVDLEKPDDNDRETIHRMITEHVSKTGSALGIRLLYSFDKAFDSFKKVIPRDYKKILAIACEEEACGKSREEALVAAFERVTA